MRRFPVAGGCGLIGSAPSRRLAEADHQVRILDDLSAGRVEDAPGAAELIAGDVADPDTVTRAMAGMDGIDRAPAAFDVRTGATITLNELIAGLERAIGVTARTRHVGGREGDIHVSLGDPSLTQRTPGFKAEVDLDRGLRQLAAALHSRTAEVA